MRKIKNSKYNKQCREETGDIDPGLEVPESLD